MKTREELKDEIRSWGNQVEVYNDGCQCEYCLTKIKEGFCKAVDEYIKYQKDEALRSSKHQQQP